jgi:hypothetical protein
MNLTEEQIKEIVAYLNELPMKYAMPLIQYLEKIKQEQNEDGK